MAVNVKNHMELEIVINDLQTKVKALETKITTLETWKSTGLSSGSKFVSTDITNFTGEAITVTNGLVKGI